MTSGNAFGLERYVIVAETRDGLWINGGDYSSLAEAQAMLAKLREAEGVDLCWYQILDARDRTIVEEWGQEANRRFVFGIPGVARAG